MQIIDLLNELGYKTISGDFYNSIDMWGKWYRGKVDSFHNYEIYNGRDYVKMEKYTLGMAKTVCEDWANYIFDKDTRISAEKNDQLLQDELSRLNFFEKMVENVECGFAEGTSAVTIITDKKDGKEFNLDLNYINNANMIYPLSWNNGQIIDCCFASYKFFFGKKYLYLNFHELEGDKWKISNRFWLINDDGSIGAEVTFDNIATEETTNIKRYFIFSPLIRNNYGSDNPMGISIFANAIDQIKGVDTIYDSYINEFIIGRKRIIASASIMHTVDERGTQKPTFDPKTTVFYSVPQGMDGANLIKEINMDLRVQDHKDALQDMLNALSIKIGMGTKHYSFMSGTITATEVKSSTDTLYNSMLKHETRLEGAIKGLCESILAINGHEDTVSVEFSDSVIHDQAAEVITNLQLNDRGIVSKAEVRAWWTGEDDEVAANKIEEIQKQMAGQMSFGEEQFSNPVT